MSRILIAAIALTMMAWCQPNTADAQVNFRAHGAQGAVLFRGAQSHAAKFRGIPGRGPIAGRRGNVVTGFYYPGFANTWWSFQRPEQPPYFAKYPPVYYSADIVKRPYGVSPYAAPSGVVPVEMQLRIPDSNPVRVTNPYVAPDTEPTPAPKEEPESPDGNDT